MQITRIGDKNLEFFLPLLDSEPSSDEIALGVIEDGEPVAAASFRMDEGACLIGTFFVAESYRRKGIGSFLLGELMKACGEIGAGQFICFYRADDALTEFLSRSGFFCAPSSPMISFHVKDMLNSPRWNRLTEKLSTEHVRSVSHLTGGERAALAGQLEEMGFDRSLLAEGSFDPDISFYSSSSGRIVSLLLSFWEEGRIYISLLASLQQSFTSIPELVKVFLDRIQKTAVSASEIVFFEQNEKMTETLNMYLGPEKQAVQGERTWTAMYQRLF